MNGTNWLDLLWQIPVGLAVLSFLVLVHEGGHFLLARRNKVTVKAFSIGFGPRLFGIERGGTDYRFCAVPLGGYVLMAGEEPDDVEGAKDPNAFDNASLAARAAIVVAGPLVNIAFAWLIVWGVSMVGVREPVSDTLVVASLDKGGPGEIAGLRSGDTLVSVQGRKMEKVESFVEAMALRKDRSVEVVYQRAGEQRSIVVVPRHNPDSELDIGWAGVYFGGRVGIGALVPGGAAEAAGLLVGDTIVSVSGHPLTTAEQLSQVVVAGQGQVASFEIARPGGRIVVPVKPRWSDESKKWMVGIQPGNVIPLETRRYGPVAALERATRVCWQHSTAIFRFLGALVTGTVAPRNLAGPIGIVQMSGRAAQEGWGALIDFMALISINLGILNLMPLVITDGGRLVELGIEKIRGGRRANRRFMEILTNVVVYAFLALALYITFHDMLRIPMFLR